MSGGPATGRRGPGSGVLLGRKEGRPAIAPFPHGTLLSFGDQMLGSPNEVRTRLKVVKNHKCIRSSGNSDELSPQMAPVPRDREPEVLKDSRRAFSWWRILWAGTFLGRSGGEG